MDPLPARLSRSSSVKVVGTWQRHVPARFAGTGLQGRSAVGRWGTAGGDPVLYLGKPTDSVVVEAYRHLIDPVVANGGAVPPIRPRVLLTCEVSVTNILDLRSAATLALSGLTLKQLQSDTSDKAAYAACQNVSAAAHQLDFHGLVAPAATKLGETLVLFTDLLPPAEHPVGTANELWVKLPPDPRSS
jgi:RES domain-containing protein